MAYDINTERYSFCMPARIQKYYPETQTADVILSAEHIGSSTDQVDRLQTRVPILGVPVHTPSGGGWSMTFPIKAGNTCEVRFSQVGYDHWLYEDKDAAGLEFNRPAPHLKRKFSEEDGFCQVGFNTLPQAILDYSATDTELRNSDRVQRISLKEDLSIEIVSGTTSITLTKDGDIAINTSTKVEVTAPDVNMSGNLTVAGDIQGANVTGTSSVSSPSMLANGKQVAGHDHNGQVPPL